MDQNRSETNTNQQQNVHLHMHHVCNCQNSIYPTYYPAMGYRTPVATTMVPYPAPPTVARPYLQHYQYTQFNMGSQYTVPLAQVASGTSLYNATPSAISGAELFAPSRSGRERESQEGNGDGDRINEPPLGYDYGHVTPPANELLVPGDSSEVASPENFVKFLERSCLTAEQIAYRNRNRPCFRNIQNLCIRTRSEILKPCTTISNIHSQGIPWATKDFIYAFVRLTNCWHILKGYWENRDGASLGKIEKELTPEFRACYIRWEKETIDLAAQLTRVFYNLDTNLNTPSGVNVYTANNLVPPQVNLLKSSSTSGEPSTSSTGIKKNTVEVMTTASPTSANAKTVRGILHLPNGNQTGSVTAETVDQGNQTCAGDFPYREEEFGSDEDARRVYMKPGSYSVPKKGLNSDVGCNTSTSPRGIEFLETAQNVNKARDAVSDRYWSNVHVHGGKKLSEIKVSTQEDVEKTSEALELELNHLNVHDWLLNSNFSDFGETSTPETSPPEIRPCFIDSRLTLGEVVGETPSKSTSITVLHRKPSANSNNQQQVQSGNGNIIKNPKSNTSTNNNNNGRIEITSRTYRKRTSENQNRSASNSVVNRKQHSNVYELKNGGITEAGMAIVEKLLLEMKEDKFGLQWIPVDDKEEHCPPINLDVILKKLRTHGYLYINEIIRDLRYLLEYVDIIYTEPFCDPAFKNNALDVILNDYFPGCDFKDIKGDLNEKVGPLKMLKLGFADENNQY